MLDISNRYLVVTFAVLVIAVLAIMITVSLYNKESNLNKELTDKLREYTSHGDSLETYHIRVTSRSSG